MATHTKLETLVELRRAAVVVIYHHDDPAAARAVLRSLAAGGIVAIEFTNRGDHALETFRSLDRERRELAHRVLLGVGSVVDAATAAGFIGSGADFVVGPALSAEVAAVCHRRQIPYVPGCGTLTEMLEANELGCELVKAFPAGALGGPSFLSAVLAPCPWLAVIPTGGVEPTEASLRAWYDAGAFAVGIGSKLVRSELVDTDDWAGLESASRALVELVGAVKGDRPLNPSDEGARPR